MELRINIINPGHDDDEIWVGAAGSNGTNLDTWVGHVNTDTHDHEGRINNLENSPLPGLSCNTQELYQNGPGFTYQLVPSCNPGLGFYQVLNLELQEVSNACLTRFLVCCKVT
jgi:hypothetical protein